SIKTEWGEYHTSLYEKNIFADGTRFGLIIEQIKKLNPQSVLEIAGNQGLLAKEISKFVDIVICSDIDEKAVDKMYQLAKRENAKIYPMLRSEERRVGKECRLRRTPNRSKEEQGGE